ncbi:poly-gamma-glutamate biosynthesis protein PgsC/CapC [Magnetococcales bacterium HHB-1]
MPIDLDAIFPLALFPEGSLSSSVITTVWVGVMVVTFFNLRLGWVFSGLVVPGYLVPLLISKPWAALAVFIEGVVTYIIVYLFSERLSRWGLWSALFGRDRFFAMVLVSVLVRILFDGWLFPIAGEWVNTHLGWHLDYRNNLHSFGLIIVSLVANIFWKTGFWRGMVPFSIQIGITYIIIRYGLMVYTNFTMSTLGYMYEDVAASMLASPKSYIILLTASAIASRLNLLYGWDFNGILIPSLLALQWYQPMKVLVTFTEVVVIIGIASLVLRLPLFKKITVEGSRKVGLFFNISFFYKITLGYFLVWALPHLKVTDYYGFGYLLPTLMAVKMHDKEIVARLTRATLQGSLAAVAGASLLGFILTILPSPFDWQALNKASGIHVRLFKVNDRTLNEMVRDEKIAIYKNRDRDSYIPPLPHEADTFAHALKLLKKYLKTKDERYLSDAINQLDFVRYKVIEVNQHYLYIQEQDLKEHPRRGWGAYILNMKAKNSMVVQIPAPLEEWGALEVGTAIFTDNQAQALLIAGAARLANPDRASDVLVDYRTPFYLFHREFNQRDTLQVRGYTNESWRVIGGIPEQSTIIDWTRPKLASSLWVKTELPPSLNLKKMEQMAPGMNINWSPSPLANIQRDNTRSGFAEIFFNRADMRRSFARTLVSPQSIGERQDVRRIDGYLQAWLFSDKERIARRGSNQYTPPLMEELLFWDAEVLTPLLRLADTEYKNGQWSKEGLEALAPLAEAAGRFGYQITRYHHIRSQQDYLLISEKENLEKSRFWGVYVLRLGASQNYIIQVPRPLFEGTSFEYGVSLFERLQGKMLLIGGTHPATNLDGSSDLVRPQQIHHLFNLVNQVTLREWGDQAALVLQSRAFGWRFDQPSVNADVLLSFNHATTNAEVLPPLEKIFWQSLQEDGLHTRFVNGDMETAGYEGNGLPQAQYLRATENKNFGVIWVSPEARTAYRQQVDNLVQEARFRALGIVTQKADLVSLIKKAPLGDARVFPEDLRQLIRNYMDNWDVVALSQILERWPHYQFKRIVDFDSAQAFLLISNDQKQLDMVVNLVPRQPDKRYYHHANADDQNIRRFVDQRAGWLEILNQKASLHAQSHAPLARRHH